jgi:hypothetical protein
LGRFRRGVADIDRLDNFPSNPEGRAAHEKANKSRRSGRGRANLGQSGRFRGPWKTGMAAYNRGDYVPALRVTIKPSLQDAPT